MIDNWNPTQKRLMIYDNYQLETAEPRVFATHAATYDPHNVEGVLDFETKINFLEPPGSCYWIIKQEKRLGGVYIKPNGMQSLFIVPPFEDMYGILHALTKTLLHWSDPAKPIRTWGNPSYSEHLHRLGFWPVKTRLWMMRPTESFEISWPEHYQWSIPIEEMAGEMGQISYECRAKLIEYVHEEAIFGLRISADDESKEFMECMKNMMKNPILTSSSSAIRDSNGNLVAFCLVSMHANYPLISDIVVHPEHQGKGLAKIMIKHALHTLAPKYSILRLFVTRGIPAESLYTQLGFIQGHPFTSYYMPFSK